VGPVRRIAQLRKGAARVLQHNLGLTFGHGVQKTGQLLRICAGRPTEADTEADAQEQQAVADGQQAGGDAQCAIIWDLFAGRSRSSRLESGVSCEKVSSLLALCNPSLATLCQLVIGSSCAVGDGVPVCLSVCLFRVRASVYLDIWLFFISRQFVCLLSVSTREQSSTRITSSRPAQMHNSQAAASHTLCSHRKS